jgi:RND family efflux transporter MFP subunit
MRLTSLLLGIFMAAMIAAPGSVVAAEVVTAERVERAAEFHLDGRIEAVNKATVSAQTSGRIIELPYDVDDFVPAGAVIVRFRDTEQQAALERAAAAYEEVVARSEQAGRELERVEGLVEDQLVSRSVYDQAKAEAQAATARLESARSAVKTAEEQLAYTRVRAPYAGIVTERFVEKGELAQPGQPLMSGLSLEQLRVLVDVPQRLSAVVREQPQVEVITPEGERITTGNIRVFPFADEATHTFRLRADLPSVESVLFPGMLVKAVFSTGSRSAIVVPAEAVARRGEVTAVYVRTGEEDIRLRQVRAGRTIDDMTEILAGLDEGERVMRDPVAAAALYQQVRKEN